MFMQSDRNFAEFLLGVTPVEALSDREAGFSYKERVMIRQARIARRSEPAITPPRQLELALEVYDRLPSHLRSTWDTGRPTARNEILEPLPDSTATVVRNPGGSRRVNSGRANGSRIPPEMAFELDRLLDADVSPRQIALLLGISSRTVARHRTKRGQAA